MDADCAVTETGATEPQVTRWIILRTSPSRTLPLMHALLKAGIEAWAPARTVRVRVPRSRRFAEFRQAILPCFVFASADCLGRLILMQDDPAMPVPAFSIFREQERVPVVDETELERLRGEEERERLAAIRRARRKQLPIGTRVRLTDGPYRGMRGTIEQSDGRFAKVALGGRHAFRVATYLLIEDVRGS